jgi:predicted nucleotidyltransferase
MDLQHPLRTVVPGVDGDVLVVLARTRAPLTGNKVSQLAGRSYSQVRAVLHRLVDDGLAVRERHGQAFTYVLNRDHIAAPAIEHLARAHQLVEERIRDTATSWSIPPLSVTVFGSFARRDGTPDSDIDVLLVRPDGTPFDEPSWAQQRYELATAVQRWTGNPAQIIDLSVSELRSAAGGGEPLVEQLRADARTVFGEDVAPWLESDSGVSA